MYLSSLATLSTWISFNRQLVHVQCSFGCTYCTLGPKFMRCTKNTFKETVWELQGTDCWGEKPGMWEGREADGHLHSEHTETDRKAGLEKCSNSLYKWHPERLVSQRTTLIPQLGLGGETPTYTVNGKVSFEKWGPHRDLIHWLTPGRGAFSPGRLCDLDWDYTLVWILSFSPLPRFYTDKESRVCALKQIPFHFHHGMK